MFTYFYGDQGMSCLPGHSVSEEKIGKGSRRGVIIARMFQEINFWPFGIV